MTGRLQDSRLWLGGAALIAVVIVVVSWLLLIGPEVSSAGDHRTETAEIQQQNDALTSRTQSLKAKSEELPSYTASLQAALDALPYDGALPAFTRQLNAQAKANRVSLTGVTVGGVTPVETAAPAAGTASTPSGTPTSAAPTSALLRLDVTLQSEGALSDQLAFLRAVRTDGPRRLLVTSTQLSPGAGSGKNASVTRSAIMSTQLTTFSAPKTPAQVAELKRLLRGDLTS